MGKESAEDAAQHVLSEQEIRDLSDAFNFLYHGLKEAKQRFENRTVCDNGRDGAVHALEYILKFFTVLERAGVYPFIIRDGVHAPLARLFDDLMSLDNGRVPPMLLPKKKSGRARASATYDGLKGIAVFTVRRLEATGLGLTEARKIVADELARAGIRPARKGSRHGSGLVSERTLRDWSDDIDLNETAKKVLGRLEAAFLREVLDGLELPALPTGSTPDDRLLQSYPTKGLRRAHLAKLTEYLARMRSQETT
jgi:hypothetical protein